LLGGWAARWYSDVAQHWLQLASVAAGALCNLRDSKRADLAMHVPARRLRTSCEMA
jgi:hypothetical protein